MFTVLSIENAAKLLESEPSWCRQLHKEYMNFLEIAKELVDGGNDIVVSFDYSYSDDEKREAYEEFICDEIEEMDELDVDKAVILVMCGVSPDILLC